LTEWLRCQGGRAMGAVVSMVVVVVRVELATMMAHTNKHVALSFTCTTHVQTCANGSMFINPCPSSPLFFGHAPLLLCTK
jgi:hypothetical protein